MGEETKTILNQNTLIPLGALVIIAGAVFWFAAMAGNIQSNKSAITTNEARITLLESKQSDVTDRLARIETQLDIIIESLK